MSTQTVIDSVEAAGLTELVTLICKRHHVTISEVCSRMRYAHIVRARHEVWFAMHEQVGFSYPAIGRMWECDHTSVWHGVHKTINGADVCTAAEQLRRVRIAEETVKAHTRLVKAETEIARLQAFTASQEFAEPAEAVA